MFCTLYGVWGDDFIKKKVSSFRIFFFQFVLLQLIFLCYNCSIKLKRRSEHSGLRPDTSSLVKFSYGIFFDFIKELTTMSNAKDTKLKAVLLGEMSGRLLDSFISISN